jgi:hypothetical protein
LSYDQKFEEMIRAGRDVVARDFHEIAVEKWRKQACESLTKMLGPDHPYTLHFRGKASKPWPMRVLSGLGVLCAAKESMFHESLPLNSSVNM